jgi:hypothetical protein
MNPTIEQDQGSSWKCGTGTVDSLGARGLSLSMLLSSLGTSIANVALPTLGTDVRASFQEVQWVVLAYLLAITTLIVSVGRLGDITGRRRLLLAGIFLFTVASVLCGVRAHALAADCRPGSAGPRSGHHDGPHHGVCRRDGSKGKDRQRHGAARNDVRDWHRARSIARWRFDRRIRLAGIFLVNVPLGILAFLLARRYLPVDRREPKTERAELRSCGHAAAGPDARGLCARHDDGARQFRFSQPGSAVDRCPSESASSCVAETRVASPLIRIGDVPRSRAECEPRHERARLDGDDGDAGGRAVLSLPCARARCATLVGLVLSVGPLAAALSRCAFGSHVDRLARNA